MHPSGMQPNSRSHQRVLHTLLAVVLTACCLCSTFGCTSTKPHQLDAPKQTAAETTTEPNPTTPTQIRHRFTRLIMGVEANVTIESELPRDQVEHAARTCFDRLAQLDAIFSDYKRDSELNNLTHQPPNTPIKVSDDLFTILAQSQLVSEAINGAFDITVGPYVTLWRAARQSGKLPTQQQLDEAKKSVGYNLIQLDKANKTVTLLAENMKLDLGGIAKGYAAAEGVKALKAAGFPRCLVALAGDIAAGDAPINSEPNEAKLLGWRIDIDSDASGISNHSLRLQNRCVSTSGDINQFIDIAGTRYSHIIDARTGLGAINTKPVTIVGPNGAITDALATAFTLMSDSERHAAQKHFNGYVTP